jgi:hypothetical protein
MTDEPKAGTVLLVRKFVSEPTHIWCQVVEFSQLVFITGDRRYANVRRWLKDPLGWGLCWGHPAYEYEIPNDDDVPDEVWVEIAKRALK